MSLIILKEGKERETEQQQLNPNIALYTFGYAGGQHTHFFSYFKKKKKKLPRVIGHQLHGKSP